MWTVEPKSAVGPLRLGMDESEFTRELGGNYEMFKRVPNDADIVYAYDDAHVHLTCGEDAVVKIISVFQPQKVSLFGVQFLGRPTTDVCLELEGNGVGAVEEDAGYWIESAGILLVDVDGVVDGMEMYLD